MFFLPSFQVPIEGHFKGHTRKAVEVISSCCGLFPPRLKSKTALQIALSCDTTFSNEPDTAELARWHLNSDCTEGVSEKPGFREYLGFLKEFVLMELEESPHSVGRVLQLWRRGMFPPSIYKEV